MLANDSQLNTSLLRQEHHPLSGLKISSHGLFHQHMLFAGGTKFYDRKSIVGKCANIYTFNLGREAELLQRHYKLSSICLYKLLPFRCSRIGTRNNRKSKVTINDRMLLSDSASANNSDFHFDKPSIYVIDL